MADVEVERAAKAARAKAMLKKRQQQKGAQQKESPSAQTSIPPSRSATPTLSKPATSPKLPTEEKQANLDVFSNAKENPDWLNSLPRAQTPPPTPGLTQTRVVSPVLTRGTNGTSGRPPLPTSASAPSFDSLVTPKEQHSTLKEQIALLQSETQSLKDQLKQLHALEQKSEELETQLENGKHEYQLLQEQFQRHQLEQEILLGNERKTISLLVSEKSSTIAQLQMLEGVEQKAQAAEAALNNESLKVAELESRVLGLVSAAQDASKRAQLSETKEKELSERYRDQERQLQRANELRDESEKYKRKVRELEERILGDDRVEKLETSLRNTQDRADELEFRLSEKSEAYATLKAEHDNIDAQRQTLAASDAEWKYKHAQLETQYNDLLEQLGDIKTDKGALEEDTTILRSELDGTRKTSEGLQAKISQVTSDLTSANIQLQTLQQELKAANRRADDAENTKRDLQAEGTQLMHSLDEMRPKIVELTGEKAELVEEVDSLQHTLKSRDATISRLQRTVSESEQDKEKVISELQGRIDARTKKAAVTTAEITDLQNTIDELKEELESALASVRTLGAEKSGYHQETGRRLQEIERLSGTTHEQAIELESLREQLDAGEREHVEEEAFRQRAESEIENLQTIIASKDEEIEHLRQAVASSDPASQDEANAQSLDGEIISSLRQQHALDLSNAHSTIRALENDVFDTQARYHALLKHVGSLEDQLAQAKLALSRTGFPSRPSSRGSLTDGRRSSLSHRGGSSLSSVPPLSRTVLEQNLSPETLHKRKISLSMLKARMESEAKAAGTPSHSHPPSRAITPVPPVPIASNQHHHGTRLTTVVELPAKSRDIDSLHRPQFMDESHVFWCHACRGDLVVL